MKKFVVCIVTLSLMLVMQFVAGNAVLATGVSDRAVSNVRVSAQYIEDQVEQTLHLLQSLSTDERVLREDFRTSKSPRN